METVTGLDLSKVMLITGTGRSGTRWLSRLFQSIGVNASHEGWFRPHGLVSQPPKYAVDVSWLGVPWLVHNNVTESKLNVIHAIRHPLDNIGSFISARVLEVDDPYREAISTVIDLTGDVVYDATNWWIQSNRIAARYSIIPTIPVEKVTVNWMKDVVAVLGGNLPVALGKRALHQFGAPDENKDGRRGGKPLRVRLDNLPGELRWIVEEMAGPHDYQLV